MTYETQFALGQTVTIHTEGSAKTFAQHHGRLGSVRRVRVEQTLGFQPRIHYTIHLGKTETQSIRRMDFQEDELRPLPD